MSDADDIDADLRSLLNLGASDVDDSWRDTVTDQIAALRANPHIVARFAIDTGGLVHAGVWDRRPDDEDRTTVYYEDEFGRPDDAPPLYLLAPAEDQS